MSSSAPVPWTSKDTFVKEMFKQCFSLQQSLQGVKTALDQHAIMGRSHVLSVRAQLQKTRERMLKDRGIGQFNETYQDLCRIAFGGNFRGYGGLIALIEHEKQIAEDLHKEINNHICWRMIDS